jgi:ATP-binding cassette subfamily C protein
MLGLSPAARRFLRNESRGKRKALAVTAVGGLINAVLEVIGLGLVFPLLMVIVRPDSLRIVPGVRELVDFIAAPSPRELTMVLAAAIATTIALKNIYMGTFSWWMARQQAAWKSALSRRMMRLYVMSTVRLHLEKPPSVMVRNVGLAAQVYDQYIMPLFQIAVYGAVALGIAAMLLVALPAQAAFSVGVLAGGAIVIRYLLRDRLARIGVENYELARQRSTVVQQAIGAIRESRILGKERYFLDEFAHVEHRSFDRQGHYTFLSALPSLVLETLVILAVLAVVLHVIFVAGESSRALATVGLTAVAMLRLMRLANRIVGNMQTMAVGAPGLELLASEIEECEPRVVETAVGPTDRLDWKVLELRGVGFTYPDGTQGLRNVNAVIRRNEFVGITGPSGSGKSTLMLVLLGLVEPTEGVIEVDGEPLSDPDRLRRWQNGIGYVPQGIFLVDGSLAQNVAFGDPKPDLARVRGAVEAAQLAEYAESQPGGVEAPLGEYGERMSGGQKQRVVIARALYRDPDLIAFDEATSTLDMIAEGALISHLQRFKSNKTVLAIAHRLSTIMHCDRILYLEKGEVVDSAPFQELKERNGNFRQLAETANL